MKNSGAIVAVGVLFILLVVGLLLFAMSRKKKPVAVAQAKPGVFGLIGQGIGGIIGNWGSWSSGSALQGSGKDSIGSGSWDWWENKGRPDSGSSLGTGGLTLFDDTFSGSLFGGAGKADKYGALGPAADAPQPLAAQAEAFASSGESLRLGSSTGYIDYGN